MNAKSLVSNMSVAFLAQGIAMAMSIIQTLLVPKVMGVEQYGFWQLFIFYIGYVGLFTFGLNDGIYLIHGGKTRAQMPKKSIASQMIAGAVAYSVIATIIIILAVCSSLSFERKTVLICAALYMVLQNVASGMSVTFQAMNETKKASTMIIVERAAFLIPLIAFLSVRQESFYWYVLAFLGSNIIRLIYSLWNMRDFFTGSYNTVSTIIYDCASSISVGIKLTLANIASQLILGVARFVVDNHWGIEAFGQVSFSLSLVNFFLAFVTQASMVLFPALRQSVDDELSAFYVTTRDAIVLLAPLVYIMYYPLVAVLSFWLPQYSGSLYYFIFLLPICVYESKMSITCATLLKVLRKETLLLFINLGTVCLSVVGSVLGAFLLHSVDFVVASMLLSIVFRSVVSEAYLNNALNCPSRGIAIWEGVCTFIFIVSALSLSSLNALLLTSIVYAIAIFFNRELVVQLLTRIKGLYR